VSLGRIKLNFHAKCENMILLQNGSIRQLQSNKGVSCNNIYDNNKNEITLDGYKMSLEKNLLQWDIQEKIKNDHFPIVFIASLTRI